MPAPAPPNASTHAPSPAPTPAALRWQALGRVLRSDYALNGLSCALGMFAITSLVRLLLGHDAAATAAVGVIATLIPDIVTPRRGKLGHLLPALLLGVPMFLAVQLLRGQPLGLGLFLMLATFVSFLGMAWGVRGTPVAMGTLLVTLFALSTPEPLDTQAALQRTLYCGLGSVLYMLWAVASNALLNPRYRSQSTATVLLALAALMRAHAGRMDEAARGAPPPAASDDATGDLNMLLQRQATLADLLQTTRNVVLESPRTPSRQRLAALVMDVLELRDYLVAGELDLERVRQHGAHAPALRQVKAIYEALAHDVEAIADALLRGRLPAPAQDHAQRLAATLTPALTGAPATAEQLIAARLLRGVLFRVTHINQSVQRMSAIARGEAAPNLTVVRDSWRLFVSPTEWSIEPFLKLWHWNQPALRHALRAALAVGAGYGLVSLMPWVGHDYWVMMSTVVVLRGSLSQTLERRNQRVIGTVLGSLLGLGVLALKLPFAALTFVAATAQGVVHAFAVQRYVITSIAASVLGLVQTHMLHGGNPGIDFLERVGDTLLGVGLAWAFSYVLPSWERGQLTQLVQRTLSALRAHARLSLHYSRAAELDTQADLAWRLARREAYDALSALVQATRRSLAEPRAVRPPLATLEQLQGHSYQLMGQLSAVHSLLLLRREQLRPDLIEHPLAVAATHMEATLAPLPSQSTGHTVFPEDAADLVAALMEARLPSVPELLPDPFEQDVSPWVLRRLHLAEALAQQVRQDAAQIVKSLKNAS